MRKVLYYAVNRINGKGFKKKKNDKKRPIADNNNRYTFFLNNLLGTAKYVITDPPRGVDFEHRFCYIHMEIINRGFYADPKYYISLINLINLTDRTNVGWRRSENTTTHNQEHKVYLFCHDIKIFIKGQ